MKYALFIWSILFFIHSAQSAEPSATSIHSFKQSKAILTLVQFMNEVKEDLPEAVLLSDKKLKITQPENCEEVPAHVVLSETLKGIKKVIRFYPDEELPLEEAYADLENYIGSKTYTKCVIERIAREQKIKTYYYLNTLDRKAVRMDIITLLSNE